MRVRATSKSRVALRSYSTVWMRRKEGGTKSKSVGRKTQSSSFGRPSPTRERARCKRCTRSAVFRARAACKSRLRRRGIWTGSGLQCPNCPENCRGRRIAIGKKKSEMSLVSVRKVSSDSESRVENGEWRDRSIIQIGQMKGLTFYE